MKIKDTVHFEWYKHLFIALLLLAFLYASIVSTDANFEQLAGNIGQVGVFLKKLANPQFSYLPKLVDPMVKTLKMSALGTALGILLAIPFAFLATTVVTDNRIITLPRYVEPKDGVRILLNQLGLTLPAQPPPKVSSEAAQTASAGV